MVRSSTDNANVAGVRAGDRATFAHRLNDWLRSTVLLGHTHVATGAFAEDAAQGTRLAVFRGIDRLEDRSSPRIWMYQIRINTAKRRGVQERREVPSGSLGSFEEGPGSTIDPAVFRDASGFCSTGDAVTAALRLRTLRL